MKSENGINNRWELLESVVRVPNIKSKFNAYQWYKGADFNMTKEEHWHGWWNECFDFVTVFPLTQKGKTIVQELRELFEKSGWEVHSVIQGGISLEYKTMTSEEVHTKAESNLRHGGRMSD